MRKLSSEKTATLGILTALALTLSFLEMLLPPLPALPPGFKIGLSNIAVMYGLFCGGFVYGLILSVLKSFFVLFVNGGYAFILSFCGSVLSVALLQVLLKAFGQKISYISLGVCGALCHNAAQLAVVCVISTSTSVLYYAPILAIAAILCGSATAAILKLIMPLISKIKN